RSVAVWVGEAVDSAADLDQVHETAAGKVRGRDAAVLRAGRQVATHLDLPWEEDDPAHWDRAADHAGRILLAGRLGPHHLAQAISPGRPRGGDPRPELEAAPGIKDQGKVRAYVEAARRAA